jgi:hypothetical protein
MKRGKMAPPLSGEFEGFLRLRVGNHRVFFKETADTVNKGIPFEQVVADLGFTAKKESAEPDGNWTP